MQMWRRNNDIKIDGLWRVRIRLRVELQSVAIVINARPKLAPVDREHDVSHALRLNVIVLNQVIHKLGPQSVTFVHVWLLQHITIIYKLF